VIGKTAVKPRVEVTALFVYAAGVSGILGNLFLIALYVLLGSAFHVSGTASDLLGLLSAVFTIPVALLLGECLTRRRTARGRHLWASVA